VVDGHFTLGVVMHRALQEEAQEALDAAAACACCNVAEQYQVKAEGRGKDRVAAEEVDLYLHRVAHPAEDVDIVPSLLVVVARGIVVDAYLVVVVGVQVRLVFGYKD